MNALVEIEYSVSPRIEWHLRHYLVVREYQHVHSLNRSGDRFVCSNRAQTRYASADSEDEAEWNYCKRYGIEWWMLADWNGAMDSAAIKREIVQKVWSGGVDTSFANSEQEMELA